MGTYKKTVGKPYVKLCLIETWEKMCNVGISNKFQERPQAQVQSESNLI